MGQPVTGAWARKYQGAVPYVGAAKWGTGINQVHYHRGDTGRPYNAKLDHGGMDNIPAHLADTQDFIEYGAPWGYNPEDLAGLDVFADPNEALNGVGIFDDHAHPNWEQYNNDMDGTYGDPPTGGAPGPVNPQTPITRADIPSFASRPWGMPQRVYEALRSIRAGQGDGDTPGPRGTSSEIPTETVNQGWLNKPASGMEEGYIPDDNVLTSDPAQYERQTSMQQRHQTLNNERAMQRGADDPRTSIPSRIAPMKLKVYSGEERHYDMFPYQMDDIPRPFSYRTAGTGPQEYMVSNEQRQRNAMQRTPPPDASMGTPDTELSGDEYGYVNEDMGYY